MPFQSLLYTCFKRFWIISHHVISFRITQPLRIITACPRIVQRRLIRAQVHMYVTLYHTLPQIHNVPYIGNTPCSFFRLEFKGKVNGFIGFGGYFIHPSLFMTFVSSFWINFCRNTYYSGNISCFWLSARHTS